MNSGSMAKTTMDGVANVLGDADRDPALSTENLIHAPICDIPLARNSLMLVDVIS